MFSAETAENIKTYRLWRTETNEDRKVYQHYQIVKLAQRSCSLVLPEGPGTFCFSASQQKAKNFLCVLRVSSEWMRAGGEFMSK
jgi:hypothetical protein